MSKSSGGTRTVSSNNAAQSRTQSVVNNANGGANNTYKEDIKKGIKSLEVKWEPGVSPFDRFVTAGDLRKVFANVLGEENVSFAHQINGSANNKEFTIGDNIKVWSHVDSQDHSGEYYYRIKGELQAKVLAKPSIGGSYVTSASEFVGLADLLKAYKKK